jgi:hypothetical protein
VSWKLANDGRIHSLLPLAKTTAAAAAAAKAAHPLRGKPNLLGEDR